MNNHKIAFIGCGAMGSTLAIAATKAVSPAQIYITDLDYEKAENFARSIGANFVNSAIDAANMCDTIMLCTKPQTVKEVLGTLTPVFQNAISQGKRKLLCSILAGVNTNSLAHFLGLENQAILRLMPNTPAVIGKGLGLIAANKWVTEEEKQQFFTQFSALGKLSFLEEDLFDAGTVLASCAPAYVYQFIEYLADAGIKMGLSAEDALHFAANACYGASAMVIHADKSPKALRDMVTSPDGSTIEGVRILEQEGFASLIKQAAMASLKRNKELGS